MKDSLFSEADLDQDLLAIEQRSRKVALQPKAEEKKEEVKEFGKKLFIIDGYSLIYRSYFAFMTHPLTDAEGKNVSAYFGFFNTLFMLLRDYEFDYFVIAMDSHAPTFRHQMYPEYKANRDAAPDDLHAQVPRITETLRKMNIPFVAKEGLEADDLIATLASSATRLGVDTVMVTGDKDLLQLVNDHVFALRPPKKSQDGYALFGKKDVVGEFGLEPCQIVDYLSLLGDASDNVPGVKGIGAKGAVKLLTEYVSLDGIYRHLDQLAKGMKQKLTDGKEAAYLSRSLIVLKKDAFEVPTLDTAEYKTNTIDYAAGIEDFEAAACHSLSRSALAFAHGDKPQPKKRPERVEKAPEVVLDPTLAAAGVYEAITDAKALASHWQQILSSGAVMAFDTETTSIDALSSELVGFSFSIEDGKAYYVPLTAGGIAYLSLEDVIPLMRQYLQGAIPLVGQNIKYDYKVLIKYGVRLSHIIFDTMVGAWMLDSNAGVYNMDDLAMKYLGYQSVHFDDVVEKGALFSSVPLASAVRYAAEDADITLRLYHVLEKGLRDERKLDLYMRMELPLITILADMEAEGILIDKVALAKLGVDEKAKLEELRNDIYAIAGHEFNINSSQQLGKVLFDERALKTGKKTQTGYSTDAATLEGLAEVNDPIIEKILAYRGLSKLLSTYIEPLPSLAGVDGRIHTSYLQVGTATGRLSSRNPNLQNIPIRTDEGRLIRSAFIPKEGCVFLSADYSQIELVVLAHLSGDENLRKAFREGVDVHRHTASIIFGESMDEVSAEQRRMSKTINFGIMYGMSAFRLSRELSIPRSDAKTFIDTYFARYKEVKGFVDKAISQAEEKGAVVTMFGHERKIAGIHSANKTEKAAADRMAVNTIIQGSAAEIMKKAMIDIRSELVSRSLASRLLLQVHDELIFEVPESEKDAMLTMVKEKMENAVKLSIPVKASLEIGKTWGEMH